MPLSELLKIALYIALAAALITVAIWATMALSNGARAWWCPVHNVGNCTGK